MFKSVGENLSSWWGGGTTAINKEGQKSEENTAREEANDSKSDAAATSANAKNENNLDDDIDDNKLGDPGATSANETKDTTSEDAQAAIVNTAKEWGSYLFNVTKAATKTVTKTAKQLKTKVEDAHLLDRTMLGEFSKEQEKFVHGNREKQKRSEAAVPPWVGYNEEEAMKTQILALSLDKRNFLRNPPSGVQFQFDFEAVQPVAKATLEEDSELVKMRFELVPKQVNEEHFWRNYFYRVSLIKQSTQLTSLAEQTGSTGEISSSNKCEDGQAELSETDPSLDNTTNTQSTDEFAPESPSHEAEFVSDIYQESGVSEEELRNEMHQLGMEEKKHDPVTGSPQLDDDIPEWEKELQAELNGYEVIVELDDADLESQILQELELEQEGAK